MNVRHMFTKNFRKIARSGCGYIQTPTVKCGNPDYHGNCLAKRCPCIEDMQLLEDNKKDGFDNTL